MTVFQIRKPVLSIYSIKNGLMGLSVKGAAMNNSGTVSATCVEVDEFFIGGQSFGKRGRGAENKTIVAVAVER